MTKTNRITLDDILNENEKYKCRVNVNWLNYMLPIAMRNIEEERVKKKVVKHFMNALNQAEDDRSIYVPMTVEEIKICAGTTKTAPANTFLKMEKNEAL